MDAGHCDSASGPKGSATSNAELKEAKKENPGRWWIARGLRECRAAALWVGGVRQECGPAGWVRGELSSPVCFSWCFDRWAQARGERQGPCHLPPRRSSVAPGRPCPALLQGCAVWSSHRERSSGKPCSDLGFLSQTPSVGCLWSWGPFHRPLSRLRLPSSFQSRLSVFSVSGQRPALPRCSSISCTPCWRRS